jgi:hypothetical protein
LKIRARVDVDPSVRIQLRELCRVEAVDHVGFQSERGRREWKARVYHLVGASIPDRNFDLDASRKIDAAQKRGVEWKTRIRDRRGHVGGAQGLRALSRNIAAEIDGEKPA